MRLVYVKPMFTKNGNLTIVDDNNNILEVVTIDNKKEIEELAMFYTKYDAEDLVLNAGFANEKLKQHLMESVNTLFERTPKILLYERKGDK